MTLTNTLRHKRLRQHKIPTGKELQAAHRHYRGCEYLQWPMSPELIGLLLLTLAWRTSHLLFLLGGTGTQLERSRAIQALNSVLGVVDSGLTGMDTKTYHVWLSRLDEEVRVMRTTAAQAVRGQPHQAQGSGSRPGPQPDQSAPGHLREKVAQLLRETGLDLAR